MAGQARNVTFNSWFGDDQPRYFFHHAVWESGETRTLSYEDAKQLKDAYPESDYPGAFTYEVIKSDEPKIVPDAPATSKEG